MKGWLTCSSMRRSRMMLRTLSLRTTTHLVSPNSPCMLRNGVWRCKRCKRCRDSRYLAHGRCESVPSSLRMYLRAKDRPVSLRSTMRTLPKAPRPTTRRRRKWLRFTRKEPLSVQTHFNQRYKIASMSSWRGWCWALCGEQPPKRHNEPQPCRRHVGEAADGPRGDCDNWERRAGRDGPSQARGKVNHKKKSVEIVPLPSRSTGFPLLLPMTKAFVQWVTGG